MGISGACWSIHKRTGTELIQPSYSSKRMSGYLGMTKLQIISKLWSVIYDMQLKTKSQEEINQELNILEYECRKYADTEDMGD